MLRADNDGRSSIGGNMSHSRSKDISDIDAEIKALEKTKIELINLMIAEEGETVSPLQYFLAKYSIENIDERINKLKKMKSTLNGP